MGNSSYGLVQSDSQNRLGLRSITASYESRLGFFSENYQPRIYQRHNGEYRSDYDRVSALAEDRHQLAC